MEISQAENLVNYKRYNHIHIASTFTWMMVFKIVEWEKCLNNLLETLLLKKGNASKSYLECCSISS